MATDGASAQVPSHDRDTPASLTIGELATRSGLTPATLRMWESRHGFPVPQRLDSGHRRYTEEDVERIQAVLRHKDAGTRLELAIVRAMVEAEPTAPSVYATLRKRHPALRVHRLQKSTLMALSWAIEDEFCSKADRAVVYGSFQDEKRYLASESRWREIARVSSSTTVFANFQVADFDGAPMRVPLVDDAPMRREWAVVCDARDLPVVLTAWELPGQDDVPDRNRLFESVWSVDGEAVHDAARVCATVARDAGAPVAVPEAVPYGGATVADVAAVTALFNRMVAYVDRLS